MSFRPLYHEDILFYVFDIFQKEKGVNHLFTTKIGDCTGKPLDIVSKILEIPQSQIAVSSQVHKTSIAIVEDVEEYNKKDKSTGIDGLITNKNGIALVTYYADCVPLYFLDRLNRVVGLAHAGWRGTVENIGSKMVHKMVEAYKSNPGNIIVGIGPSIGPCCYEIGNEVYKIFKQKFNFAEQIFILKNDKIYLDLWKANRLMLIDSGILDINISVSKLCTSCNIDKFYSYRKEEGTKRRMAAAIQLKY